MSGVSPHRWVGGAGGLASPLSTWFRDAAAIRRFRRARLGRAPVVLPPRDGAWRSVAPGFAASVDLAASGLPCHVVADRRVQRSVDRRRLRRALAAGKTVYLPQVHQVLPRVMRLMVGLRAAILGPFREECSFLFLVEGRGRPGMGLHHDGPVDGFWLQLAGRRTVTTGPRVAPATPEELADPVAAGRTAPGWRTRGLEPGTLFYLPPFTPHRVLCRGRSLALSLTWKALEPRAALEALLDRLDATRRSRPDGLTIPAFRRLVAGTLRRAAALARREPDLARAYAAGLAAWDVVSGHVETMPPITRDRLWTQVPAVAAPVEGARRELPLLTGDGEALWLPAAVRPLAAQLATMPSFRRPAPGRARRRAGAALALLERHGIVAPQDLPLRIVPDDPAALDGWRFA